jgi:transcriptional regulator with XRE-family HTH domain
MTSVKQCTTFGETIRALREEAGLTLREVAANIDVDPSLLAKIERNQRKPSKALIHSIAEFFKVDTKWLQNEFLSDQIAYKIFIEDADLSILKIAEKKVSYFKTLRNE